VVRPGDTLWAIAEQDLSAEAPAAVVAARWQQIYHANRTVIGADPDLLLPGTALSLPPDREESR
jgi:nucleoid-associated protein YgaU